eukprot:4893322-Pyramimonas_sp.AAC.1
MHIAQSAGATRRGHHDLRAVSLGGAGAAQRRAFCEGAHAFCDAENYSRTSSAWTQAVGGRLIS